MRFWLKRTASHPSEQELAYTAQCRAEYVFWQDAKEFLSLLPLSASVLESVGTRLVCVSSLFAAKVFVFFCSRGSPPPSRGGLFRKTKSMSVFDSGKKQGINLLEAVASAGAAHEKAVMRQVVTKLLGKGPGGCLLIRFWRHCSSL